MPHSHFLVRDVLKRSTAQRGLNRMGGIQQRLALSRRQRAIPVDLIDEGPQLVTRRPGVSTRHRSERRIQFREQACRARARSEERCQVIDERKDVSAELKRADVARGIAREPALVRGDTVDRAQTLIAGIDGKTAGE